MFDPACVAWSADVVFYREDAGGILVVRILHQRMMSGKQAIDDEDDGP